LGNDFLDGGAGVNTADFMYGPGNWTITFNLDGSLTATSNYGNSIDTLTNIQFLTFSGTDLTGVGTVGTDVLTANLNAYYLLGAGDDTVTIGTSGPLIDGGAGTDTVIFSDSSANYTYTNFSVALFMGSQYTVSLKDVELAQFSDRKFQL